MVEKTRFQRWKEVQETRTRRQHLSKSEQKQLKNLKGWTARTTGFVHSKNGNANSIVGADSLVQLDPKPNQGGGPQSGRSSKCLKTKKEKKTEASDS